MFQSKINRCVIYCGELFSLNCFNAEATSLSKAQGCKKIGYYLKPVMLVSGT